MTPAFRTIGRVAVVSALAFGALGAIGTSVRAGTTPSCDQGGTLRIGGVMHSTMGTGGIPGIYVRLTGPGPCQSDTSSGPRGGYLFSGLLPGTYTIAPFRAGCGFDPPRRTVTLSTRGRVVSFDATCV